MSDLPTEEDFHKLPLRSLVAYTARAAMRSRPRFRLRSDSIELVDAAIEAAVCYATNKGFVLDKARYAEEQVVEAIRLASDPETGDRGSALAANVAYAAVNAAVAAAEVEDVEHRSEAAAGVVAAAVTATECARAVHPQAKHGLEKDFASLVCNASVAYPDLGDPVDVGPNGPLGKLACKPLPGKKGPAPNEVDLLEILRLRDEMQAESGELQAQRAAFETARAEIDVERAAFEEERARLDAEREQLNGEVARLKAFNEEFLELLGRHGLALTTPVSEPSTPAKSEAPSTPDDDENPKPAAAAQKPPAKPPATVKAAKPQPPKKKAAPGKPASEESARQNSAIAAVDALLNDLSLDEPSELVTA